MKIVKENLDAAKLWLTNAEQAYNSDSEVFADMNLFLAETEIRHLREKTKKNKRKFLSKMSFCIIIILVLCFFSDIKVFDAAQEQAVANRVREQVFSEYKADNNVLEQKTEAVLPKAQPVVMRVAEQVESSESKREEIAVPTSRGAIEHEQAAVAAVKDKDEEHDKAKEARVNELSRVAEKSLRGL